MDRLAKLLIPLFLLVTFPEAAAEMLEGAVAGRVVTQSDEPIVRVHVILADVSGRKSALETATDQEGRFRFEGIKSGEYQLSFSKRGWLDHARVVDLRKGRAGERIDMTVVMEITPDLQLAVMVRLVILMGIIVFGMLVFVANYWIAPTPSKVLGGVGWSMIAISIGIAAVKEEWLHAALLALVGIPVAAVINRCGKRAAARRRAEMEDEQRVRQAEEEEKQRNLIRLVGCRGAAATDLKPFGRVQIDDVMFDARARRGFLTLSTPVLVAEIDGRTLVVEEDRDAGDVV